jgi:hypothetical protein
VPLNPDCVITCVRPSSSGLPLLMAYDRFSFAPKPHTTTPYLHPFLTLSLEVCLLNAPLPGPAPSTLACPPIVFLPSAPPAPPSTTQRMTIRSRTKTLRMLGMRQVARKRVWSRRLTGSEWVRLSPLLARLEAAAYIMLYLLGVHHVT